MIRHLAIMMTFIASASSCATEPENSASIGQNPSVDACIAKYKSNNIECLDSITETSEKALDEAYKKKLNGLKSSDLTSLWMGNQQQKDNAISQLIENQKKWIDYRESYCSVALWSVQNSQHLGEAQTSCELNMNIRRIEEISLIGVDSMRAAVN